MRKPSIEFLRELLATPTPSGHESEAQRIWCAYVRPLADEVRTDAYGNAVAVLNPGGDPKVMLESHIDQIGLVVKYIDGQGFLYVQRIGGVDPALVPGKRVRIHSAAGPVGGVVGATPIHLQDSGSDRKAPKFHDMYVDIGAKSRRAAAKRVSVGDPITFADEMEMLSEHVAASRGMDNRTGAWVVAEALRRSRTRALKCALYACSSVQEEVGAVGARMQAHNVKPDMAVVVDVTHATDVPGVDMKQFGEVRLGAGPSLVMGRENHPALTRRLRAVAQRARIPCQVEAFSIHGGNDAMAIYIHNGGIPCALVKVPTRYMHTPVETVDLRDMENASRWLAAFARGLHTGERFAVTV